MTTAPPRPLTGHNILLPLLSRLRGGWLLGLWLLITLRITWGLVALLSLRLQPATVPQGDWTDLLIRGGEPWSLLLSCWQRFDALWYQQIAEHGYRAGNNTVAFYPMFPLLCRITSVFIGNIVAAELAVVSAGFVVATAFLYKLSRLDLSPLTSVFTVLLVVFFPTGFFLLAPYTEGLFLAFALASLYFARRGQLVAAGFCGLGAGLTRAQGAFLVLPLVFASLQQRTPQGWRIWTGWPAATLPALGALTVEAYDHLVIGENRTSFQVLASHWGYHRVAPWTSLIDSWRYIARTGELGEILNLTSLVACVVLGVWATRRLPLLYALYLWPWIATLLIRESYSPLLSVSRYVLTLFPCFMMLAIWLRRRPYLAATLLVISALFELMLFTTWVHFGFVA